LAEDSKYRSLLDAETWSFIERTNSFYPEYATDLTIAEKRNIYDKMCDVFRAPRPSGVKAVDGALSHRQRTVPIRKYWFDEATSEPSAKAQIVYFHGGGYVLGGLESHDDVCAELCAATACAVMAVDYALAPENTYPADFEDALAAFEHATNESNLPIILMGDSAGATLAASVSHKVRNSTHQPIGQILIYPALNSSAQGQSYRDHEFAPMLSLEDMEFYRSIRVAGQMELCEQVECSPLVDTDFTALPPTVIFTAECDPLASDGDLYAQAIKDAGGKAHWVNEKGLIHGYLRARHTVGKAKESFARMISCVNDLSVEAWPYDH